MWRLPRKSRPNEEGRPVPHVLPGDDGGGEGERMRMPRLRWLPKVEDQEGADGPREMRGAVG